MTNPLYFQGWGLECCISFYRLQRFSPSRSGSGSSFFPKRLRLLIFFQSAPAFTSYHLPAPALDYWSSLKKYFFPTKNTKKNLAPVLLLEWLRLLFFFFFSSGSGLAPSPKVHKHVALAPLLFKTSFTYQFTLNLSKRRVEISIIKMFQPNL